MASCFGSKLALYPSPTDIIMSIEIVMDGAGPRIGGDAKLSIVLKNTSSKQRTASLLYEVMVMYYTGVLKDTVKKDRIPIDLKPQEIKKIMLQKPLSRVLKNALFRMQNVRSQKEAPGINGLPSALSSFIH
ncbi:hypothetical protein G5714_022237 [Onychostoma macrolepis]|uniref:Transglutaminase C-terminal domain-containing protein n=1 Tax=Onychostoma macrolepis TaxID=369639 RepID=A0A7J6BMK5_9TELE|nr:hypothetical protein G5714_022237 [Onychostoma macrolepis]